MTDPLTADQPQITRLLRDYAHGDEAALDRLYTAVYAELRRIAHRHMQQERDRDVLSTTVLVHECYLGLFDQSRTSFRDRDHFFGVASTAMRHILIDLARRRMAKKRGGDRRQVTLEDDTIAVDAQAAELIALGDALETLAEHDERMAKVVECRFFGGLSVEETAQVLDVSARTVERDWTRAKAHLRREMEPGR